MRNTGERCSLNHSKPNIATTIAKCGLPSEGMSDAAEVERLREAARKRSHGARNVCAILMTPPHGPRAAIPSHSSRENMADIALPMRLFLRRSAKRSGRSGHPWFSPFASLAPARSISEFQAEAITEIERSLAIHVAVSVEPKASSKCLIFRAVAVVEVKICRGV